MRDDFRAIYDNPHTTRRAILTRGRKNSKTTEAALIILLHLCGPEVKSNTQLYSTALSREQAGVLFDKAAKIIRMSPTLHPEASGIRIKDSGKQLLFPKRGTVYKALSAEASTAYGLNPAVTIHDELGQVRGPTSPLYEAMESATGSAEEPLSVIISTQAPTDNDLLSRLIDDAMEGHDPRTVLRIDTAHPKLDPFSIEAIRAANPAFDIFMNKDEVLAMADTARRMPSRQAEYENLVLNRRVETANPLFPKEVWMRCGHPVIPDLYGKKIYAGLDLSASNDLTALVCIAADEGRWHIKPTFWLPEEGLRERSRLDKQPYDVWARMCSDCVNAGELECSHPDKVLSTTPGSAIEYEFVAEHLRGMFDIYDMRVVGFDRAYFKFLKPWLVKAGFTDEELERFIEYGQGYMSMGPAIRDLETAVLNDKIAHGNNPGLMMCCANAVVSKDPAGNRKLDKKKARGRIDGMVALAMAIAVANTEDLEPPANFELYIL
jgi:phage terminase large subunit-like protein